MYVIIKGLQYTKNQRVVYMKHIRMHLKTHNRIAKSEFEEIKHSHHMRGRCYYTGK